MSDSRTGQPWTSQEVRLCLRPYFEMLRLELDGRDFVKSHFRAELESDLPDRSDKSIEFKWCNVSAVLDELELPWIQGYKPAKHYQRSLMGEIQRWLSEHPSLRRELEA